MLGLECEGSMFRNCCSTAVYSPAARRYALQSDISKSTPWLTFMGWVSNGGNAHAPICCSGIDHVLPNVQGSLLVFACGTPNQNTVLRVVPFYHR